MANSHDYEPDGTRDTGRSDPCLGTGIATVADTGATSAVGDLGNHGLTGCDQFNGFLKTELADASEREILAGGRLLVAYTNEEFEVR